MLKAKVKMNWNGWQSLVWNEISGAERIPSKSTPPIPFWSGSFWPKLAVLAHLISTGLADQTLQMQTTSGIVVVLHFSSSSNDHKRGRTGRWKILFHLSSCYRDTVTRRPATPERKQNVLSLLRFYYRTYCTFSTRQHDCCVTYFDFQGLEEIRAKHLMSGT